MVEKSNLLQTYEAAKAREIKRQPFEIIDGKIVALPRLNLGGKAKFERWMIAHGRPGFSLSELKNAALMELAGIATGAKEAWLAADNPEKFPAEQAEELANRFFGQLSGQIAAYTSGLFKGITQDAQEYAVYLAFRQEFGSVFECDDGKLEITEQNVRVILEAAPSLVLGRMCLWVTGLEDWIDQVDAEIRKVSEKTPTSIDDAIDQKIGDSGKSEPAQARSSTSGNGSPSSASPTDETTSGPGD